MKKILAPFDLTKPEKKINGFLYPNIDAKNVNSFLEINTDKEWEVGMVVFVGREISKNDVFAKIVDSGKKIKSVNGLLNSIEDYLGQVSTYKIGDVIGIKSTIDGFKLIKLEQPQRAKVKLP